MIVPEITIYNYLEQAVALIRTDYEQKLAARVPETSWLFRMFKGTQYGQNNAADVLVKLIASSDKSQRISMNLGYSLDKANLGGAAIHLIIPSEQTSAINGIGFDEGYIDQNKSLSRNFDAQYNILITSGNMATLIFLYHFLRAVLILYTPDFENSGLQNIKIGGQDISFQQDLVPLNIYHRILTISFAFDVDVFTINRELYNINSNITAHGGRQ